DVGQARPFLEQDVGARNLFVLLQLVVLIDDPVEVDASVAAGQLVGKLSAGSITVAVPEAEAVVGIGWSAVAEGGLELAQEREPGLAIDSAIVGVVGVEFGVGVFVLDGGGQLDALPAQIRAGLNGVGPVPDLDLHRVDGLGANPSRGNLLRSGE